jgi:hypothetical protein
VPAISYTVISSDGQVSPSALAVTVLPVGTPASAVYSDAADTVSTPMGQTATGNVLANANIPAGTTAQVTGFSIAGSTKVYPAGSNVTLTDPITGEPIGTLTLAADGTYVFDPVDGYLGPTPAINVYSQTSKGTTAVSSLTLDVLPGEHLSFTWHGSITWPRWLLHHAHAHTCRATAFSCAGVAALDSMHMLLAL